MAQGIHKIYSDISTNTETTLLSCDATETIYLLWLSIDVKKPGLVSRAQVNDGATGSERIIVGMRTTSQWDRLCEPFEIKRPTPLHGFQLREGENLNCVTSGITAANIIVNGWAEIR